MTHDKANEALCRALGISAHPGRCLCEDSPEGECNNCPAGRLFYPDLRSLDALTAKGYMVGVETSKPYYLVELQWGSGCITERGTDRKVALRDVAAQALGVTRGL